MPKATRTKRRASAGIPNHEHQNGEVGECGSPTRRRVRESKADGWGGVCQEAVPEKYTGTRRRSRRRLLLKSDRSAQGASSPSSRVAPSRRKLSYMHRSYIDKHGVRLPGVLSAHVAATGHGGTENVSTPDSIWTGTTRSPQSTEETNEQRTRSIGTRKGRTTRASHGHGHHTGSPAELKVGTLWQGVYEEFGCICNVQATSDQFLTGIDE